MSASASTGKHSVAKSPPAAPLWKQALLILASLAAIAAAAYFLRQGRQTAQMPTSDGQLYEACGQALAEETARLLGNQGKVVILTPRTGASPSPVHARYLSSFKARLGKQRGLTVAATEQIAPTEAGCPATAFLDVLKKHPTADAVVSFIGPPVLQGNDFKTLPARRPKLVALGGGVELTRTLMTRKILDASFLPRRHAKPTEATPPKAPLTQFDQFYQLVTPATLAAWSAGEKP